MIKQLTKKDLIYDGDDIRRCPKNVYILGYWKSLFLFYGYDNSIRTLVSFWDDIVESFRVIGAVIIYLVIFPIHPFLSTLYQWRKAVKDVNIDYKEKNNG